MNTLAKEEKKHIKAIARRLDWLANRIAQQNNTFDRAERTAIKWLIERAGLSQEMSKVDVRESD